MKTIMKKIARTIVASIIILLVGIAIALPLIAIKSWNIALFLIIAAVIILLSGYVLGNDVK